MQYLPLAWAFKRYELVNTERPERLLVKLARESCRCAEQARLGVGDDLNRNPVHVLLEATFSDEALAKARAG